MKAKLVLMALVLVAMVAIAALGVTVLNANTVTAAAIPAAETNLSSVSGAPKLGAAEDMETAYVNIYSQVNPSVVAIEVVSTAPASGRNLPQIPGFPFFGNPNQGQQNQLPQQALGSGFVWDANGNIVTNNHVVSGADRITVTFSDGTIVPAKVVGTDPDSDLAVVKVDAAVSLLRPVQVADSSQVKVGQLAVAIGNPYGEQNTMTTGIVSALGRDLPVNDGVAQGPSYTIPDVIQTDAPINPGNSGGVLLNLQGQVIGVTSAIESRSGSSAGIGFAIPSAIVKRVVPALIKSGKYEHPYLGISGTTLTPALAQAMSLKAGQRGAVIMDITPGGPSEKAGLRGSTRQTTIDGQTARVGGDVVTAFDGKPVKTFQDLPAYLARSADVNQTVTLTILRDGNEQTVNVTLAARPASAPTAQVTPTTLPNRSTAGGSLGISGITLTPNIAKAMNLKSDQEGVLIERIAKGSAAEKAGLTAGSQSTTINGITVSIGGDVIVSIDGQPVSGMGNLQSSLRQAKPGQVVTLGILRNGKPMDIKVTLDGSA